jgi:Polyketide cyclase / dehydrase and lipid transport
LFQPLVTRSELVSDEPVGPGSRFVTVNRGQEYDATITTYEPPERLGFEVTGKQMEITATFTFAAVDGGTELTGRFDFRPKGVMKLIFPLVRPMIRRDLPKQSAGFKTLCEGTAPAATG